MPEEPLKMTVGMPAAELLHSTTIEATVVVTGMRLYAIKMAIATLLFQLAARLLGCDIKVDYSGKQGHHNPGGG